MSHLFSWMVAIALINQIPPPGTMKEPIDDVAPAKLTDQFVSLSPARVQVGGWLGARIAANEKQRLLHVDTEPLLAGYRQRPGQHPWIGEHIGKWLHAATLAWVYTDDPALKAKLDQVVRDLVACQESDGYLGTYLPAQRFGLYQGADWDVWSHKYNMIGLLTYYQFTGHRPALECSRKMADLLIATFPAKKSILAAGTHVGMAATSVLEPVVLLYRLTGEPRYLEFAQYLVKSWSEPGGPAILESLNAGKGVNETANSKAYEMLSNLVGLCELARITGDRNLIAPVEHAWSDIVANHLYVTGSASVGEHFREPHDLPNDVGSSIGETCVTTTWIQLCLQLLRLSGDARYGNELERTFYNHLTAAQHPQGDDWCYYTPLEGVKPYDSRINCCHSSGPRGLALSVQAAYFKTRQNESDALVVSTFESSRATLGLNGRKVIVEQTSQFPHQGRSELVIQVDEPATFGILIRSPAWAGAIKVAVNGQALDSSVNNGYVAIASREWNNGDRVSIDYRFESVLTVAGHSNEGRCSLSYGPFVLAYDEARNPGLPRASAVGLPKDFADLKKVAGAELAFHGSVLGRTLGQPVEATFIPFADAGADRSAFRVFLRAPGVDALVNQSKLADGAESRSRNGNQRGSINDGDPNTHVVTFDDSPAREDWYAVTLSQAEPIRRIVFRHGQTYHDGGWFDAHEGKPRVEIRRTLDGPWEQVGELTDYPAATATNSASIKRGQPFECRLDAPTAAVAVRVVGVPATGDNPNQAFSSCAEIEAYGE